jgi:4-hydroxybenzoate polyprenyltransferase
MIASTVAPKILVGPLQPHRHFLFHCKTAYLFVCNYNVIIVIWALMGYIGSCRLKNRSATVLHSRLSPTDPINVLGSNMGGYLWNIMIPLWMLMLDRFLFSLIWVTIVATGFSISNQRRTVSIREDSINKPWRPIPSNRISPSHATKLLLYITATGFLFSTYVGVLWPYTIQLAATYHYNDLGGANGHYIVRDILNAIGMISWLFGCIGAAGGTELRFSRSDLITALVLVAVTTTTVAVQDFRDIDGDRQCGRNTLPIALGEKVSRYLLSISILSWSAAVVVSVGLDWIAVLIGFFGILIVLRLVLYNSHSADKLTTELWYGWFAAISLGLL